jgi:hypothetical protein
LAEAESVEWIVPIKNTMLEFDTDSFPGANNIDTESIEGHWKVTYLGTKEENYGDIINSITYRINSYYS